MGCRASVSAAEPNEVAPPVDKERTPTDAVDPAVAKIASGTSEASTDTASSMPQSSNQSSAASSGRTLEGDESNEVHIEASPGLDLGKGVSRLLELSDDSDDPPNFKNCARPLAQNKAAEPPQFVGRVLHGTSDARTDHGIDANDAVPTQPAMSGPVVKLSATTLGMINAMIDDAAMVTDEAASESEEACDACEDSAEVGAENYAKAKISQHLPTPTRSCLSRSGSRKLSTERVSFRELDPEVRYIEGLQARREELRIWQAAEFEQLRREALEAGNPLYFGEPDGFVSTMVMDANAMAWAPDLTADMDSKHAPTFGMWCCSPQDQNNEYLHLAGVIEQELEIDDEVRPVRSPSDRMQDRYEDQMPSAASPRQSYALSGRQPCHRTACV